MPRQYPTYLQKFRCGCLLEFARKKDVPRWCPQHLRDRQGEPLRVPPSEPADNAMAARFDREARRVIVQLPAGVQISFPQCAAHDLSDASPDDMAVIEVVTLPDSGLGLRWPCLGRELSLSSLLSALLGGKQWMASQLGAAGGQVRTSAKAASSRENGRKGGRPRLKNAGPESAPKKKRPVANALGRRQLELDQ